MAFNNPLIRAPKLDFLFKVAAGNTASHSAFPATTAPSLPSPMPLLLFPF